MSVPTIRPVPISDTVVDRVLDIETENVVSRLRPLEALPGNPFGVYIRRFGRAVALATERIDWSLYNSVLDIEAETADHLDEIESFYRHHGGEGLLEVAPGRLTARLGSCLAARGYAMTGFHCGLVRSLGPEDERLAAVPGVVVETIDPTDDQALEVWIDTYSEGWSVDPTPKAALRTWAVNRDRWRFYLARVDGAPAAAGVLDVRGKTALNASASTRPEFRGRRAQSALIRARIRDAAHLGCDLFVGGAYFGTTSMRNHQREGFSTAFTRGIWTPSG